MTGRILSSLSLIVVALSLTLAAAACGGDGGTTATDTTDTETTPTSTVADETTKLRVYFLLDGKVQPVAREVAKTQAVATAALDELVAGPSTSEGELGLTSEVSTAASGSPSQTAWRRLTAWPISLERGSRRSSTRSRSSPR